MVLKFIFIIFFLFIFPFFFYLLILFIFFLIYFIYFLYLFIINSKNIKKKRTSLKQIMYIINMHKQAFYLFIFPIVCSYYYY